jgi:hypothetical protein
MDEECLRIGKLRIVIIKEMKEIEFEAFVTTFRGL